MKKIVLGIALAAAILTLTMILRGGEEHAAGAMSDHSIRVGVKVPGRLSADAVLSISPGTPAPRPAIAANARMSALLQEYAKSKNYKDLHQRLSASTSRTPEESWMLAEILDRCARITEQKVERPNRWSLGGEDAKRKFIASLSEKDPLRAKRIAAFEEINNDVCAGIADIEISEKDVRMLYEAGAAGGDPKARIALVQRDLSDQQKGPDGKYQWTPGKMPLISDPQLETLKQGISSGDPYAILAAARALGSPMQNLSLRTGAEEMQVDFGAFYGAATLTACEYGYACGADSRQLMSACAMRGQCGANDYREYLFYYGNSPATSQMIGDYHAALSRAARESDWSFFTFHRGPSTTFAPYQSR